MKNKGAVILVKSGSDVNERVIYSGFNYEDWKVAPHPLLIVDISKEGAGFVAIAGTSDKKGRRKQHPEQYHEAKKERNPFLDVDTYFDLETIYSIRSDEILNSRLRILGELSEGDLEAILNKIGERTKNGKIKKVKASLNNPEAARERQIKS